MSSVAANYDSGMGPVIFEPYAKLTAESLSLGRGSQLLEVAAGTGRLTRHLVENLPDHGRLIACDLNLDMVEQGRASVDDQRLEWIQADALDLPFAAAAFDLVTCQFGVMFYSDKLRGHQEALRVLKPGGTYVFLVWGSHAANPWARVVHETMLRLFPESTPGFMAVPFSYHDEALVVETVQEAGFTSVQHKWIDLPLVAPSAHALATGAISGSRLGDLIRQKGVDDLQPVIEEVANGFIREFGPEPMQSTMSALRVEAIS